MIQIVFAHLQTKSPDAPFGFKNRLPWPHCPEDLKQFKEVTTGTVLLMGSKTFKSLPGILPDRPHVVLSSKSDVKAKDGSSPHLVLNTSIESAIRDIQAEFPDKDISIIGGPKVIEDALPFADRVIKTTLWSNQSFEYDTTINLVKIFHQFPNEMELSTTKLDGPIDFIIQKELTKWKES